MRLLEHYASVQGEGPRTGTPTQFVRFAGCNLRCPGWPCDTPFAIEPKQWRKEAQYPSNNDLLDKIQRMAEEQGARNICLTGGEPLLQPTNAIVRLAQRAVCNLGCTVETFTNGSRRIPAQLTTWSSFVMDWKLAGSGEKFSPEYESNRRANVDLLNVYRHSGTQNSIKFVCKDVDDLHEALDIYEELDLVVWSGNVYFGVVWGGDLKAGDLVDRLLVANPGRNWYLNVQTHNYIFNPQERGR